MTMKTEKPKFEKGLILLCNKCKPRLAKRNLDAQPFDELKSELKMRFKKAGFWGKIRACETSCLGHCPLDASTIFIQNRSTVKDLCISVTSEINQQEIIDSIERFLALEI